MLLGPLVRACSSPKYGIARAVGRALHLPTGFKGGFMKTSVEGNAQQVASGRTSARSTGKLVLGIALLEEVGFL